MKTFKISAISVLLALPLFVFAQSKYIPEDDIYVSRGEENPIVKIKRQEHAQQPQRQYPEYNADTDENNDQSDRQNDSDSAQYAQQQGENGRYLNDFNGSQSDYEYAERIRRFHNPRFIVHISDPAYSNIYFLNSSDWNVYTDGNYAWVTPTWTNYSYYNYMWAPYSYRPSWQFGWYGSSWSFGYNSWCDPWYSPYYSYGYYGYCNPYYGYHHGYYGGYYGNYYGGYYGHGGYYGNYYSSSYTPRDRNDAGRRPINNDYPTRGNGYTRGTVDNQTGSNYGNTRYSNDSRYTSTNQTTPTNTNNGGQSRYTYTPNTRPTTTTDQQTTTNSRPFRYTQPASNYTTPVPDSRQNRTVDASSSTPTPRTNYYSGSSGSNSRTSSSYSGGNTQSRGNYYERSSSTSSYSTPSYSSGSSSSGSYSGGGSSRSSSGGGESRSSGGRR